MPYFNYSGYDAKGKNTKGTVEAGSSIQAVDKLTERGIVAVDIKLAEDKKGGSRYKKLKIEEKELHEKTEAAAEAEDFEKAALYKTRLAKLLEEIKKLEKQEEKELEKTHEV